VILRTFIVDDEAAGRLAVRSQCEACPDVDVVGECDSGRAAIERIRDERPDVAFLDIKMRPISGLDVAASLDPQDMPAVVFVTAYDKYAVRAFDLNAVDYVLKPLDGERFARAISRVRERIGHSLTLTVRAAVAEAVQNVVRDLRAGARHGDTQRLLVEIGGQARFLAPEDIECVMAQRNYVVVRAAGTEHTVRATLDALEQRLTDPRFLRVHRSVIINTALVKSMEKGFHGEYLIEMKSGRTFTSGRTYRRRLRRLLLRSRLAPEA